MSGKISLILKYLDMENNYWLQRISYYGKISHPLLKYHGYLSIGFSDFLKEENFIENLLQKGDKYLDATTIKIWGEKSRIRKNLSRFMKMKKGDRVLVPDSGVFSIYEIDDEKAAPISILEDILKEEYSKKKLKIINGKLYEETEGNKERLIDLGFVRKVKPVHVGISRKRYADAKLIRRLKFRGTNSKISDLAQNIEDAQDAFLKQRPINIHSQIEKAISDKVLNIIRDKLNPAKWEHLIKVYLEKCGADSIEKPSKKEIGDADVIAVFEKIKTKIFVQAKFHEKKTKPNEAVRQIYEFVNNFDFPIEDEEYTNILWVISSADSYSQYNKYEILEKGVKLITGIEFTRMLLDAGISDLDEI